MTYSSSLHVGRQRFAVRGQNVQIFRAEDRKLGPISNAVVLVVLLCVLGLVYLTQVTKTNAYSYQINQLQQQQQELKNESSELEVAAARQQAPNTAAVQAAAQNLVSVAPSATLQN